MSWLQRYRLPHYLPNAIWVYPVATMVLAILTVRGLHWLEMSLGWQANLNVDTTRTVLSALAGAVFTFIVFVCSSMLLVVQLSTLSSRPASSARFLVIPLFRIHGSQAEPLVKQLRRSIAIGAERTIEQDPAFAFRLIVDIASKGLSPAINDPTTAVLAIDRIRHLLRHVGSRQLDNERVRDAKGQVRLVYRTPDWDDFVILAVTEIRQFGASSVQFARRLRAMLEDLIRTLPDERAEPLRRELRLLKKSSERFFLDPEDRARADESDAQGVGGAD